MTVDAMVCVDPELVMLQLIATNCNAMKHSHNVMKFLIEDLLPRMILQQQPVVILVVMEMPLLPQEKIQL